MQTRQTQRLGAERGADVTAAFAEGPGSPVLAGRAPRAQLAGRARSVLRAVEPALITLALLALWELASRSGLISVTLVPAPTAIAGELVADVQTNILWTSVWWSLQVWGLGFAIVIAIAIPLGLVIGSSSLLYRSTHLTVEFLRMIPSIAAVPFLVLVYGVTLRLGVIVVVLSAVWPLLIQVMYGMRDVDPVALETGRVYRLGRLHRFTRIALPSAAPYIGTGLRVSGVIAMIVAIAVPLIVGGEGLGAAIALSEQAGERTLTYARIFVTGLLGFTLTILLMRLERRLLRWHPAHREAIV